METTTTKPETKAQRHAREREELKDELRKLIKPGDTIYTVLRHTSRSGMYRRISCYIIQNNKYTGVPEPICIDWFITRMGIGKEDRAPGVGIGGAGMDMGYHIVYELSRALFHGRFTCLGQGTDGSRRCPSNDHTNGDRNYEPHQHTDGGYALTHRWI